MKSVKEVIDFYGAALRPNDVSYKVDNWVSLHYRNFSPITIIRQAVAETLVFDIYCRAPQSIGVRGRE